MGGGPQEPAGVSVVDEPGAGRLNGGAMRIRSREGRGTIVSVRVPVRLHTEQTGQPAA